MRKSSKSNRSCLIGWIAFACTAAVFIANIWLPHNSGPLSKAIGAMLLLLSVPLMFAPFFCLKKHGMGARQRQDRRGTPLCGGGLDLEWKPLGDRPGHRLRIAALADMGNGSGSQPALGLGPRITYFIGRVWALQAQVGLLARRRRESDCSNDLGYAS